MCLTMSTINNGQYEWGSQAGGVPAGVQLGEQGKKSRQLKNYRCKLSRGDVCVRWQSGTRDPVHMHTISSSPAHSIVSLFSSFASSKQPASQHSPPFRPLILFRFHCYYCLLLHFILDSLLQYPSRLFAKSIPGLIAQFHFLLGLFGCLTFHSRMAQGMQNKCYIYLFAVV